MLIASSDLLIMTRRGINDFYEAAFRSAHLCGRAKDWAKTNFNREKNNLFQCFHCYIDKTVKIDQPDPQIWLKPSPLLVKSTI